MNDIEDLPKAVLNEIAEFFRIYKKLEGKETEVLGWEDKSAAIDAINHSIDLYKKEV